MERHDVYRPALHGNPLNGGAVGHGLARLVRIGYFQQRLDRIFRRDGLRIVVAPAADGRVGVAVTGRQCRPAVGQEPGGGGLRRIRIVLVDGGRFAPYADVGIVFLHPRDEVVVIVRLVGPHAVLDVPVEHAQVVGAAAHLAERADLDIVHVEAVHAAAHVVAGPVEHRAVGRVVYDDLHVVPLLDGRFARRGALRGSFRRCISPRRSCSPNCRPSGRCSCRRRRPTRSCRRSPPGTAGDPSIRTGSRNRTKPSRNVCRRWISGLRSGKCPAPCYLCRKPDSPGIPGSGTYRYSRRYCGSRRTNRTSGGTCRPFCR